MFWLGYRRCCGVLLHSMSVAVADRQSGPWATGEALKPRKCKYSPVAFTFDPNGDCHYDDIAAEDAGYLSLENSNWTSSDIDLVPSSETIKVAGVRQALDGNMMTQVEGGGTSPEGRGVGQKIDEGALPWKLAWQALCTNI